jgi:hypothetical protein
VLQQRLFCLLLLLLLLLLSSQHGLEFDAVLLVCG